MPEEIKYSLKGIAILKTSTEKNIHKKDHMGI